MRKPLLVRKTLLFLSFSLLSAVCAEPLRAQEAPPQDAVKTVQESPAAATTPAPALTNRDLLGMLASKLPPETVAAKIRASAAREFDTSAEAIKVLREAGATDAVIAAVVEAGAGAQVATAPAERRVVEARLPVGTKVELESAYRVSSQEVRVGDLITFRVVNPVVVDGVTVVEKGATATARVTKASRGGHFGRAGRLVWTVYEVTAADGTRVSIDTDGRRVGDSKGAKVATQMAITAAAMPLIAPVALLHGFKRGENAYLPEGARIDAFVRAETTVRAAAAVREE